jgi:hypothetical protein
MQHPVTDDVVLSRHALNPAISPPYATMFHVPEIYGGSLLSSNIALNFLIGPVLKLPFGKWCLGTEFLYCHLGR